MIVHMDFCIAKEFVQDVFKEFKKNLKFHINHDHPHLSQLRGYKFLVSAKNEKAKIFANDFGDLLTKVRMRVCLPVTWLSVGWRRLRFDQSQS